MNTFRILLLIFGLSLVHSAQAKKDTTILYCNADLEKVKKKYAGYKAKIFDKKDGLVGATVYRRDGSLYLSGSFLNNKLNVRHGDFVYYDFNGNKMCLGSFENNSESGIWKYITPEGIVTAEGEYKFGKRSGKWVYLDYEGNKSGITNYKAGKFHGEYYRWKNDTLIIQGQYDMDNEVGVWKKWYYGGVISAEGAYKDGKRDGNWKFYHPSGKLAAEEVYEDGEALSAAWFNEKGDTVSPKKPLEKDPEFTGGMSALAHFIQDNVNYPEDARENGQQGIVYVQFFVHPDGKVTGIRIRKGVAESLDKEAINVVEKMPNWIPGINHGRDTPIEFTLPIHFRLG